MNIKKIKQDCFFYFWFGLVSYITNTVLNVIHLYQWKGREPLDFLFHLVLLSLNITIIAQIKELQNWARNAFIVKFIILALVFYPQVLFVESGGWVYSGHWPHGVFQRISNMSVYVYEFFFCIYLAKRAVRFVFVHGESSDSSEDAARKP
jgi:hypothetical protein